MKLPDLPELKLPEILEGVPRIVLLLAIPVIAFLITLAFAIGTGGSGDSAPPPTVAAQAQPTRAPPTPQPTVTPTAVTVRTDCNAIRGTDYSSDAERVWFQENCSGPSSASGGGASSSPSSGSSSAQATTYNQVPTGETLVIPRAGVNAPIYRTKVAGGYMADPWGYDNALSYDFDTPGLGGDALAGNFIIAGHVDCGRCRNGGSGTAVFWSVRQLAPGDTAQVYTGGKVVNYVVTLSQAYSPNTNWGAIVSTGAADMTIITCTGTFSGGEYNLRHVVQFAKA